MMPGGWGEGSTSILLAIELALPVLAAIPSDWTLTVNASPLTLRSPRLLELLDGIG